MALSPLLLKSLFGCVSVAGVGTAASFTIYQAYTSEPADLPSKSSEHDVSSDTSTSPKNETTSDSGKSSDSTIPSDADKPSENDTTSTSLQSSEDTAPVAANPVVLVKAKSDFIATSKLSVGSTESEYKCKVSDANATIDFCRLVKLDITNNWIDVSGIKKANLTDTVSVTGLQAEDNHFKLEVNTTLHSALNLSENKHIEIISSIAPNKTLAKLNVSFKVSDAGIDYVSTNYVLGKTLPDSSPYEASANYECPFSNANPAAASPEHACAIYPFGSTAGTLTGAGYHKQVPTDLLNTKATNPLSKDQYYILNYTTPVTKSDLTTHKTAYINKQEGSTITSTGSLKNLLPVITQGTTTKKLFILSDAPSYSIIVKKHAQLASGTTITHTSAAKNYQCKYDTSAPFDCELVELDLSDSKTSMNVADIKNADLTTDLSVTQSENTIKFFKLDVPLTHFDTIKTSLTATPTTVKLVEITNGTDKIGEVTPIFAVDDNNLVHFHKSSYVVSSATPVTGSATFAADKKKYCAFVESASSPLSDTLECDIKDLGTSITAATDFTSTTDATSISTSHTYLVTSTVTLPTAQDIKDKPLLVLQVATGDDSSKTQVASFTKEHIKPALVVDGDNSKKRLFILS